MGKFSTEKIGVPVNPTDPTYYVEDTGNLDVGVDVLGHWRSKPKGKRLFTSAEIRDIRNFYPRFTYKRIAEIMDCSHVNIYMIVKRAIYCDVV